MQEKSIRLDHQLCHRFYVVSNAFTRAYRPLLAKLDITYPQYVVLMALWEQDEVSVAQLVERTRVDGGAMSLILKKLEAKQYVMLEASREDKRVKRIKLTTSALKAKREAMEVASSMRCNFESLSAEETVQLMSLIDKLSSDLSASLCETSGTR